MCWRHSNFILKIFYYKLHEKNIIYVRYALNEAISIKLPIELMKFILTNEMTHKNKILRISAASH